MIRVERGGRTLDVYRVNRYGVFIGEAATVEELAALGVELGAFREEPPAGQ